MTSGTGLAVHGDTHHEMRSTASQLGPTVVLVAALVAHHAANVVALRPEYDSATLSASTVAQQTLLDALVTFHGQLASSQQDLPEDAARILRENLWQLYE